MPILIAVSCTACCLFMLVQSAYVQCVVPYLYAELWDACDSDDDSNEPIEDEHHAIFECSGYVYARDHFQDVFQSHITTVRQFVNQPQCNRLAKFLTWIRACCMNLV